MALGLSWVLLDFGAMVRDRVVIHLRLMDVMMSESLREELRSTSFVA